MTTIDTSVLSTIEDNVKYTMLQLMHEILKSYNQSLDIIGDLNENQQELDGRVTKNTNDITKINGTLELVRDSIEQFNGQMNATRPSELNKKINANTEDITTINNQLAATAPSELNNKINDNTTSISSLTTRLNTQSKTIATHTQQLAGTAQSGLLTKINKNTADIQTNAQAINQWAQETQQNSTDISTNMNSIESLEGNFNSLSSKRGYLPEPVIETCNNSTVKQRGTDNYWSVPITTPARSTEAGKIIIIMTTERLTNAGTNPLYLTFDDGSGIFTTFIPIVRYNNYQIQASVLGALPGNLMVLVLYDDPTNGLVARVISDVTTA